MCCWWRVFPISHQASRSRTWETVKCEIKWKGVSVLCLFADWSTFKQRSSKVWITCSWRKNANIFWTEWDDISEVRVRYWKCVLGSIQWPPTSKHPYKEPNEEWTGSLKIDLLFGNLYRCFLKFFRPLQVANTLILSRRGTYTWAEKGSEYYSSFSKVVNSQIEKTPYIFSRNNQGPEYLWTLESIDDTGIALLCFWPKSSTLLSIFRISLCVISASDKRNSIWLVCFDWRIPWQANWRKDWPVTILRGFRSQPPDFNRLDQVASLCSSLFSNVLPFLFCHLPSVQGLWLGIELGHVEDRLCWHKRSDCWFQHASYLLRLLLSRIQNAKDTLSDVHFVLL